MKTETLKTALDDASKAIALAKSALLSDTTAKPSTSNHRIGIFVGHGRRGDMGAVSVGDVSEWNYNNLVAARLSEALNKAGISNFKVNHYEGDSYGAAMSWVAGQARDKGATLAIELHFNSAQPLARGHEYLYYRGSVQGEALAKAFSEAHAAYEPDQFSRGIKPKSKGDRGSGFLSKTPCPAVICEPFFWFECWRVD